MTKAHARSVEETLEALEVDLDTGLSEDEARRRIREHGPNRLSEAVAGQPPGRSWPTSSRTW